MAVAVFRHHRSIGRFVRVEIVPHRITKDGEQSPWAAYLAQPPQQPPRLSMPHPSGAATASAFLPHEQAVPLAHPQVHGHAPPLAAQLQTPPFSQPQLHGQLLFAVAANTANAVIATIAKANPIFKYFEYMICFPC
jgi:hypothetical protein